MVGILVVALAVREMMSGAKALTLVCGHVSSLFRMSTVFTRPSFCLRSVLNQWLVDSDELINQVVEALLVFRRRVLRLTSIEVLSENLLKVLVKLLGLLVFGKVLFVVFD